MREDIYGPRLQAAIEQADTPITAAELAIAAGCSRQRAYQWLERTAQGVVEAGRNTRGAQLLRYAPTEHPTHATGQDRRRTDTNGELVLGMRLVVTGMHISDNGVVFDMSTADGVIVHMLADA